MRKALEYVEPERVHLTTDCGLFSLPRPMAQGKLARWRRAAQTLRDEIGG